MTTQEAIKLGDKIGAGANSSVFEVQRLGSVVLERNQDHPRIAKLTDGQTPEQAVTLYQKSCAIANVPHHSNVIAYDAVLRGEPFAATEVVAVMPRMSSDLSAYLAHNRRGKRGVAVDAVLSIGEGLAAGLVHLHEHGIVHDDVSFGNILVSDPRARIPSSVVIMDLENSRVLPGEAPSADFTGEFAAPERRDPLRCTAKVDVFSLAVVLHALASGAEYPGIVDGVPELGSGFLSRKEMTPARVAAVVHRDLPEQPQLAALLVLALNHEPETRISMSYFRDALGRLRRGEALEFPDVLAPMTVRVVGSPDVRGRVLLGESASVYDVLDPCCICGNTRHVGMKQRTDCVAGQMHLPGNMCPGSERLPHALGGDDMIALPPDARFHYLYPMYPDGAALGSLLEAEGASDGRDLDASDTPSTLPAGTSVPSFTVAEATPEPSSTRLGGGGAAAAGGDDDQFEVVVDGSKLLNSLQLHGGFAVSSNAPNAASLLAPLQLMVVEPPGANASRRPRRGFRLPLRDRHVRTLAFTAPLPWPSECTSQLRRAGRVHSPTPALLRTPTAAAFAWIMPGEKFHLENGEEWVATREGGFVFFFASRDGSPHELDRFFGLAVPLSPTAGPSQSLPLLHGVHDSISHGISSFILGVRQAVDPQAVLRSQQQAAERDRPPEHQPHYDAPPPTAAAVTAAGDASAGNDAASPAAAAAPAPEAVVVSEGVPLLPITVHRKSVTLSHVVFRTAGGSTQWRCGLTGEEGSVEQRHDVSPQVARALGFDSRTRQVAFLRTEVPGDAPSEMMFPHHGIVGWCDDGGADADSSYAGQAVTGVYALRIGCKSRRAATSSDAPLAVVTGEKVKLLIPSEGPVSDTYDPPMAPAPLVLTTPAVPDEASSASAPATAPAAADAAGDEGVAVASPVGQASVPDVAVTMVAVDWRDSAAVRFYFATRDGREWHVRSLVTAT